MHIRPFFVALFFSFGFDQISKWFVLSYLNLMEYGQLDVFPPLLRFVLGWNKGINFGFLSHSLEDAVWVMLVMSLIIPIGLILWARHIMHRSAHWVGLGFLTGGALGNALDRFRFGSVIDFLNVSFWGMENPYIFNFADCFIFLGLLGLIVIKNHPNVD